MAVHALTSGLEWVKRAREAFLPHSCQIMFIHFCFVIKTQQISITPLSTGK
jgi:hypothetical protein